MDLVVIMATGLLLAATLLPLWRHPHWIVRGMDFPRLQLVFFALTVLMLQVLVLDAASAAYWVMCVVGAGCLFWQLWWILPYTRLWPPEVKSAEGQEQGRALRLLTANVLMTNRNAARLLELVQLERPDILVTLESDAWWENQLDRVLPDMPFSLKCPLDNLYGMHLYSRLPMDETEVSFLVEPGIPSMHAQIHLPCGAAVRMHFLHPAPPSPTENPESAERDAELVIVARSVANSTQPVVVTGDLNDVAWSATTRLFRKLSGLLDPRVGRGMFNTFHAGIPLFRWPLDHLFHSEHFTVREIRRLPAFGSDHFALLTELYFNPVRGDGQDGLQADADDRDRAWEIADEQGVQSRDVPKPGE